MERNVSHKLRLGLDNETFLAVEEIYQFKKSAIPKLSRNDVLVELIKNGILVEKGIMILMEKVKEEKHE